MEDDVSHTPQACKHDWSGWLTEARKTLDGVEYILVRHCYDCAAVEEVPFGRDT